MRNIRAIALLLTLCMLLAGCRGGEQGYTGTLRNYEYRYEDGRDRQWEEDVLYVAEVFLGNVFANGHPVLTDEEFQIMFSMDGKAIEKQNFYDPQAHTEFLQDINALISDIGILTDYEILFALEKAVAKLSDLHSSVSLELENYYPLWLEPFRTEEGVQFRAVMVPGDHEELAYARLLAVNGVLTGKIARKLDAYNSFENRYAAMDSQRIMVYAETLDVLGVTNGIWGADFTFELLDGSIQTVYLSPFTGLGLVSYMLEDTDVLLYRDSSSDYWWEYVEEDQLLYVRFNRIYEDRNLAYSSFIKQLKEHIQAVPETERVVFDFRNNPGGYFHANLSHYISSFLNQLEGQKSYVLFDYSSYSSAIWLSSNLRQMTENTLFVGTPGGQPANFFASVHTYTMPNSGHEFYMSDCMWITDETDGGDALMPDAVVWQTLEDYMIGVDTALTKIASGELDE